MYGRRNPANTVAEECIPGDPENRSMMIPVANDNSSRSQEGISTGRRRINII
jgi:hypothetical protein